MIGFRFHEFMDIETAQSPFERLLKIFLELMTHTSGDFEESFQWLRELDDEYNLTDENYTLEDFRRDLEEKNYIKADADQSISLSEKSEQLIRKKALEQVFGKLKKGAYGNHKTTKVGRGDESTSSKRPYQFGDSIDQIAFTDSFKNAQVNHGIDGFSMTENDLEIYESFHSSRMSTVFVC